MHNLNTTTRIECRFNDNNKLHHLDGPAKQLIHTPTNLVLVEEHWVDGLRHNNSGPAIVGRTLAGNIFWVEHWVNGKRHNSSGPAYQLFYPPHGVWVEEWWVNGTPHNPGGLVTKVWHKPVPGQVPNTI